MATKKTNEPNSITAKNVTPSLNEQESTIEKVSPITKSIVYGNVASSIVNEVHDDMHTHKWTVFVRPYLKENIGAWVKKVHFKLHDSYECPTRIILCPPFEVSESGWGEFEIAIKIFFQDTSERPITLNHKLKLFSNGPNDKEDDTIGISSETYEEIIFQNPSPFMQDVMKKTLKENPQIADEYLHYEEKKKKTVDDLVRARKKVQGHIAVYKNRLRILRTTIDKCKDEINAVKSQCSSSSPPKKK